MNVNVRRHVLVVEDNSDGHRLHYVKLLVREALEADMSVTIATNSLARLSAEWRMYLGDVESQISTIEIDEFGVGAVELLATELAVDHVVVPDGDAFAYALARPGSWTGRATVSALVMRAAGQQSSIPGMAGLKTALKRSLLLVANFRRNVSIRVLKSSSWQGSSMPRALRDPVTIHPHRYLGERLIEKESPLPRYWFGVVGVVDPRKNLPLIAKALASLERSDVGLIVAGRLQPGVREAAEHDLARLSKAGAMVKVVNRLLEDDELDQLISDLDCVVLAHSNEGPSGIFGKAVASGTRVVAAGAKSLKADCKTTKGGAEWVPLETERLRSALSRAMEMNPPTPLNIASARDFAAGLLGL